VHAAVVARLVELLVHIRGYTAEPSLLISDTHHIVGVDVIVLNALVIDEDDRLHQLALYRAEVGAAPGAGHVAEGVVAGVHDDGRDRAVVVVDGYYVGVAWLQGVGVLAQHRGGAVAVDGLEGAMQRAQLGALQQALHMPKRGAAAKLQRAPKQGATARASKEGARASTTAHSASVWSRRTTAIRS
jgi:hypothetical protein